MSQDRSRILGIPRLTAVTLIIVCCGLLGCDDKPKELKAAVEMIKAKEKIIVDRDAEIERLKSSLATAATDDQQVKAKDLVITNLKGEVIRLEAALGSATSNDQQAKAKELVIEGLKAEVGRLQSQSETSKSQFADQRAKELDAIKRAHTDEMLSVKENFRAKIAELEQSEADTRMHLSVSERERLALKGLVDQPQRLAMIAAANSSVERSIWVSAVVFSLGMSFVFYTGYKRLRDNRRQDIVGLIARYE